MKKIFCGLAAVVLVGFASAADLFTRPSESCLLLVAQGLHTSGWKSRAPGDFGCSSVLVPIGAPGPNGLATNIAYYVNGKTGDRASDIRVKVNINNPASRKLAMAKLREAADALFRASGESVPEGIAKALDRGTMGFVQTGFGTAEVLDERGNVSSFKLTLTSRAAQQQEQAQVAAARGDFQKCVDVVAKVAGYGSELLNSDGKPTNEPGMQSFLFKGPNRDMFFCEVFPGDRYKVKGARGGQFPFQSLASGSF